MSQGDPEQALLRVAGFLLEEIVDPQRPAGYEVGEVDEATLPRHLLAGASVLAADERKVRRKATRDCLNLGGTDAEQ